MFEEPGAETIDVTLHYQLIGHIGFHANDVTYVAPH